MTNHWIDLKNTDVILVMGSNPASNHPVSMKWIMRAREKGAKLVCVDPRFTQTAAKAVASLRNAFNVLFQDGPQDDMARSASDLADLAEKLLLITLILAQDLPGQVHGIEEPKDSHSQDSPDNQDLVR